MVTALVLQLIQCCPILPEILEKKKSLGVAELNEEETEELFNFNAALSSAKIFVNNLISRCSAQSTTKKSDNDYISILNNIVDDLLCTFSLPEWPASSYLLQFITNSISAIISKPNENPTLRCTLMETLGNILAKLKYEILTYGSSIPEFLQVITIKYNNYLLIYCFRARNKKRLQMKKIVLAFVIKDFMESLC